MDMDVSGIDIIELIPQREPMVMVGALKSVKENSLTSSLVISEDNIFSQDGYFREEGLIENIAQTAAAMGGYASLKGGSKVNKGYIGSIRKLLVYQLPRVGSSIETTVELQGNVMNIDIVYGAVRLGDRVIAECEMRIFVEE